MMTDEVDCNSDEYLKQLMLEAEENDFWENNLKVCQLLNINPEQLEQTPFHIVINYVLANNRIEGKKKRGW